MPLRIGEHNFSASRPGPKDMSKTFPSSFSKLPKQISQSKGSATAILDKASARSDSVLRSLPSLVSYKGILRSDCFGWNPILLTSSSKRTGTLLNRGLWNGAEILRNVQDSRLGKLLFER